MAPAKFGEVQPALVVAVALHMFFVAGHYLVKLELTGQIGNDSGNTKCWDFQQKIQVMGTKNKLGGPAGCGGRVAD